LHFTAAAGSRLPLQEGWLLQELPLPPPEAGITSDAATAAASALLVALGWEQQRQQQASGLGTAAGPAAEALAKHKLRAAVLLLFGEQQAAAGIVPGAAQAAGQGAEQQAWEQPLARWCLAALMQHYTSCTASSVPSSASAITPSQRTDFSGLRGWQQQESLQLAQQFAATSFGDRLFGAAVALLLRQAVPLDTQVQCGVHGMIAACTTVGTTAGPVLVFVSVTQH
jgi:hypothetical protein